MKESVPEKGLQEVALLHMGLCSDVLLGSRGDLSQRGINTGLLVFLSLQLVPPG